MQKQWLGWGLILLLAAFSVQAEDLSEESLQGDWQIVAFQGEASEDNDGWVFEDDQFYQRFGDRRISPDTFTVKGDVIDLGYAKIQVNRFDGDEMNATMAGYDYTLEKQ